MACVWCVPDSGWLAADGSCTACCLLIAVGRSSRRVCASCARARTRVLRVFAWRARVRLCGSFRFRAPAGTMSSVPTLPPLTPSRAAPQGMVPLTGPERATLFRKFDSSGNGSLSMGEARGAIAQEYPFFDNPKAVKQAFRTADTSGDEAIGRREFSLFLDYLLFFSNMWAEFQQIDADGDGRLTLEEFGAAAQRLGDPISPSEVRREFRKMDDNNGGYVLFDEFACWAAIRAAGDPEEVDDEDYGEATHAIFIYDATMLDELKQLLDKPYLTTAAAMAPQHMLVFAGASEAWDRRSVATLRPAATSMKTQSPPRKPLSALLPEWQLGIRAPEPLQPDVEKQPRVRGPQVLGYTFMATDRDVERLDAWRRTEYYHPHPIQVWSRSEDGRIFREVIATTHMLPERALPYFKAPADAYLRGIQTNLDTYWGAVGETSGIRIFDGQRRSVCIWLREFGRAKYKESNPLKAFFLVVGAQLRWRMTVDPDRAVQKVEAVGVRTVEQLRYAAPRDLNSRLRRAGFPIFKPDTLKVVGDVEITAEAMEAAKVLLDQAIESKYGGGLLRQQRSMERLTGLRKTQAERQREMEEEQRLAAARAAALVQGVAAAKAQGFTHGSHKRSKSRATVAERTPANMSDI